MLRRTLFTAVMLICGIGGGSAAQIIGYPPETLAAFEERRQGRPNGVHAGSCLLRVKDMDGADERLIYVIMPMTKGSPIVVEIGRRGRETFVTNVSHLKLLKGRAEISDNMGGEWAANMLRDTATWIVAGSLQRYPSYRAALAQTPNRSCPPLRF